MRSGVEIEWVKARASLQRESAAEDRWEQVRAGSEHSSCCPRAVASPDASEPEETLARDRKSVV